MTECPQCNTPNEAPETGSTTTCKKCKFIFGVTPDGKFVGATPTLPKPPEQKDRSVDLPAHDGADAGAAGSKDAAPGQPPLPVSADAGAEQVDDSIEVIDVEELEVIELDGKGGDVAADVGDEPPDSAVVDAAALAGSEEADAGGRAPIPPVAPAKESAPEARSAPESAPASEPAETSKERRRLDRIPFAIPVDFQLVSRSDGVVDREIRTGTTRDINGNGLCLAIRTVPPAVAQRLETHQVSDLDITMDIAVPKRPLRVSGRVAWSEQATSDDGTAKGFLVGVEFVDLDDDDAAAISRFAKKASRRPKMIGMTIAVLCLALVAGGLFFAWTARQQHQVVGTLREQLSQTRAEHEEVASNLEIQTAELLQLSKAVRTFVETAEAKPEAGTDAEEEVVVEDVSDIDFDVGEEDAGDDAAEDDGGQSQGDDPTAMVAEFKADIDKLEGLISSLKAKFTELKAERESGKKRKGSRKGKRRGKKRKKKK